MSDKKDDIFVSHTLEQNPQDVLDYWTPERMRNAQPMGIVLEAPVEEEKQEKVVLFSYWRSSCSWRVRLALNFKNIKFEYVAVNLLKNEQHDTEYKEMNPTELIPTLKIGDFSLSESIAIMEYLEEKYPNSGKNLLPKDPKQRALVRKICQLIACDIQPIQNLRVLQKIEKDFGAEHKGPWAKHWITLGLQALEKILQEGSGKFCVGDEPSMADICLIPQLYNARRFGVDMTQFARIVKIEEECNKLDEFKLAHPDQQPDAVKQ